MKPLLALCALFALTATPVFAGNAALPPICQAQAHGGMAAMTPMAGMAPDAAHTELMAGMAQMNTDMNAGGTASDIDVAFVCSMIPHHLGAISMAKAELAHGDDPWARQLAEKIIAAQEQEIADMRAWLEKQK